MPARIHIDDIKTKRANRTGHTVYPKAVFLPQNRRIIYKLNKYGDSKFSHLEVAFNALTELFLQPGLSAPQALVTNRHNQILGVASAHLFYSAHQREHEDARFLSLKRRGRRLYFSKKNVNSAENIPIYFFDQFDANLFPMLAEAEQKGIISLDMESLASILTTAFTLEEDDLHKGNLGFYIVERDGKPRVIFQTIDADMKMADSIMSFVGSRFFNWRHGENAFQITARDLRDFPVLRDSGFWYWLTKKRYLIKPSDSKTYTSAEVRSFSNINQRQDFQRAKWLSFYKHILLPTALIQQAISASYDSDEPTERANLAMITQAVLERQARLRAVLLSMPEFRTFINSMGNEEHEKIALEIMSMTLEEDKDHVLDQVDQRMRSYLNIHVEAGDTPLHVAIRLGEYSPVAMKSFREFANQANDRGQKPLDMAVDLLKNREPWSANQSIRANPSFMIHHMLNKNVQKTPDYKRLDLKTKAQIKNFQFTTQHITKAANAIRAEELVDVLRAVGEDMQFTLKMKKQLALSCLQTFIKAHPRLDRRILIELKQAINGDREHAPRPELQYIRQLRSRLWLVRTIRGLLGGTASQVEMGAMLDKAIKKNALTGPGNLSMFHHPQDSDDDSNSPRHRTSQYL